MGNGYEFGLICLILMTGMAAAFICCYQRYKNLVNKIEHLTKRTNEIVDGSDDDIIVVGGPYEINQLSKAINKMTKRLRIERERVESRKEQLNSILTSMNSGVIAIENSGKVLFYNQSFLALFQNYITMPDEELLHKSFYQYFNCEELCHFIHLVEEEKKPIRREIRREIGGSIQIMMVKATPLYKNEKKIFGTILVAEDVTRVKKLESLRKDFVSNVTHELKTPLTSIRGFVDTLKGGAIEDPVFSRRFLDIIDIEAERLSILVNDILILSEIENGTESGKSTVNVESVIDEVIELLDKNKKDSVVILKDMKVPVTDYLCNRNRLKQLILNLTDNGVKYTNEGSVTIRCWEEEQDLVLQFEDTGVGIKEEHFSRLFERFYRVDKGRSRKQGGTGLGLSIVKHIVEIYKGTITVESKMGEGSVFTVRLPYYEKKEQER